MTPSQTKEAPAVMEWNSMYPFDGMKVGDYFDCSVKHSNAVRVIAYRANRATGAKITTRTISRDTLRVWRVA